MIDFGLAAILGPNGKSLNWWNPEPFAAPEALAREETEFGGDIWALGHVFY